MALSALCALAAAPPARAQDGRAQDVAAAVRADRWDDARIAAAASADPVAGKLVEYYRMLAPGAARAGEIDAFMRAEPGWPNRALLERRWQEAVAAEPDDAAALAECGSSRVRLPAALLRCAAVLTAAGRIVDGAAAARQAWIGGITDAAAEAAFMHRYGTLLTEADQRARFDRLAWTDTAAASRQLLRLDPPDRPAALVRLAFRRDDASAPALFATLPLARRTDPALMLEHARWLRRAGQDAAAASLWRAQGETAQGAAPPDHLRDFWAERDLLARRLQHAGDAAGAYALVAAHGQTAVEPAAEAEFLAGFIALRRLHDPHAAEQHFSRLEALSGAAITQARASYWIGEARTAAGLDAKDAFTAAAAWPTTFYGQLGALALGDTPAMLRTRISIARDPGFTPEQALDFLGRERTRAAILLAFWGEPRRAETFLRQIALSPDTDLDRVLAARLALGFGAPETAVSIARLAGRDGAALPDSGWPVPFQVPAATAEPAILLGLMRQESSFDAQALSPAGARGLMQLMPATAREVAKQLGDPPGLGLAAPGADPAANMRLGAAYLHGLLDQFGQSLPLALAAYNAGPARVLDWLAANGDPRAGQVPMVDWIELIPFNETRNYVQRVLENVAIYRARTPSPAPGTRPLPALLVQWNN